VGCSPKEENYSEDSHVYDDTTDNYDEADSFVDDIIEIY
jgi:hypothetical protein